MPDMSTELISIEVVHARPEKQVLLTVEAPMGTTLAEAIELSGIRDAFPDLDVDPARLGIFGIRARLDDPLKDGDRVEIYRPLVADPKEARRKRALAQKEQQSP